MIEFIPIVKEYGIAAGECIIEPIGSGLINRTWLVRSSENKYILQQINTQVFTDPSAIEYNIQQIAAYLQLHHPDYFFSAPLSTKQGKQLHMDASGYWRLFPFVENSHTIDVVQTEEQACEAAKQFGVFAKNLSSFPAEKLKATIPDFHNLNLRQHQFQAAIQNGNQERIYLSSATIQELQGRKYLVQQLSERIKNNQWKLRVMHHDTKISNVLFNSNDKAICVIDLDTIMPGYFFSDVGDMLRTCLSPVSEEETDFSKILVRGSFFQAIVKGYASAMNRELTVPEKQDFVLAGKLMMYMQALRFLTDFLNNDKYYGAKYELHNYNRALNQIELLKRVEEKEEEWNNWLKIYFNL